MRNLLWAAVTLVTIMTACKKDDKSNVAVVSTTAATNVTATSAQTGGDITSTGGATISQSGICWAFQNNPTVGDSLISSGQVGAGTFISTMSNLNANTTYYVRAFAINTVGTAYGVIDSFITAKGLPTVMTIAASNIVPLSAQGGGNVTNNGGATVTARGICWSTSANPTILNFKTSDSTGMGAFADSMTDLASQTVYYVRAYATNSFGTAYGNQVSFTASSANTVTDIDGNVYPYVQLGTQAWMATNLKVAHYQNGDAITDGLTNFSWSSSTTGAYTFPNGDTTKNGLYGKLYSVYAVEDSRNACPVGWHVPSDAEWITLETFEGMSLASADSTGYRGTIGSELLTGGSSGLNLQLGGIIFPATGGYYYWGTEGYYWSSTSPAAGSNFYRGFDVKSGNPGPIYRVASNYGMSVRCVKD